MSYTFCYALAIPKIMTSVWLSFTFMPLFLTPSFILVTIPRNSHANDSRTEALWQGRRRIVYRNTLLDITDLMLERVEIMTREAVARTVPITLVDKHEP
ncbi:hypothetical protein EVAR_41837_1 [Eumeta japonica]|uniref:Uncharacterized protein n=1 Tax=Eumeta variegata TaxID=151549 RepID=A0A4C1XCV9_EUMVA|nr:hypothetical protein EVAR_41837_1 [Eumeta japonica]